MSSRTRILENIRRGLRRGPLEGERLRAALDRTAAHARGPVPARAAALDPAAQVDLFVAMAEEAAASVERIDAFAAVPAAVARWMAAGDAADASLLVATGRGLDRLDWAGAGLTVESGRPARDGDRVCVSPAFAAVAETGTLVLLSGPESPSTLNFLPDHHIVVLGAGDVVGPYEDVWDRLRERGTLPRTLNLITGPSRSADIEQTLQMGAHGPVSLHIVLVASGLPAVC